MSKRMTWKDLKSARADSHERRVGYREAAIAVRLGRAVKAARETLGLSQSALAERAGMPQSSVSRFEGGDVEPTITTLLRLVTALGMDLAIELRPVAATEPSADEATALAQGKVESRSSDETTSNVKDVLVPV